MEGLCKGDTQPQLRLHDSLTVVVILKSKLHISSLQMSQMSYCVNEQRNHVHLGALITKSKNLQYLAAQT